MAYLDSSDANTDASIIKTILLETEDLITIKNKLYTYLFNASLENDLDMDTDLIEECVETLRLLDNDKEQILQDKIISLHHNIENVYKTGMIQKSMSK